MTLQPGSRLGPYEIVAPIGAGGMGEVYRGRDTRLDRTVAVKVLPAEYANDEKFKIRFAREAKAISALNHPHICTLYDVGDSYLVMEFCEGKTLADRRGSLSLAEVLEYGIQIADALDKAHGSGIVHRDLKPANIMLTKSGVKLLDFGLAKQLTDSSSTIERATEAGHIVGTLQYMAPEVLGGKEADARSDIYSLGLVLHEQASGKRGAAGEPLPDPALDRLVRSCLAKDPDARIQNAHDIAVALRWFQETVHDPARPAPHKMQIVAAWTLASLSIAGLVWQTMRLREQRPPIHLNLALPPQTFVSVRWNGLAISPNGQTVVYGGSSRGVNGLFIRRLDNFESTFIEGTADAESPFFSPDGEWVAFFADGAIKKVRLYGGSPIKICNGCAPNERGGVWSTDQMIYFAPNSTGGVYKVPAAGGTPLLLARPDPARDEVNYRWPQLLPDGKHLLVTVKLGTIESWDDADVAAISVSDGTSQTILKGATSAIYLAGGRLLFKRGSSLYAVPLDETRLQIRGDPRDVFDGVAPGGWGSPLFALSANGALAYIPANAVNAPSTRIVRVDASGRETLITVQQQPLIAPRISPDGRTIALCRSTANDSIVLLDPARGTLSRLSFEPGNTNFPVWTSDGTHVLYWSEIPGQEGMRIISRSVDGSGDAQELLRSPNLLIPSSVSPDGKLLAYVEVAPSTHADIWLLSMDTHRRTPLMRTSFEETRPMFSPNGRWLAYVSDESRRPEVYVRALPPGGGRWQISTDGGVLPHWSADGQAIFFWHDGAMYRVHTSGPGQFDRPQKLFADEGKYRPDRLLPFGGYDVMRDGSFLMEAGSAPSETRSLDVILNWPEAAKEVTRSFHRDVREH